MDARLRVAVSDHSREHLTITGRILFRNSLLNLIGQVVPLLVGVATVPFIVRGLGPERFGLLSIAWVVLSYSAVFDLGMSRASTKFVAEALTKGDRESVGSIVAAAVAAQGILGVAGGLALALAAPSIVSVWLKVPAPLAAEAAEAFRLLGLAVPLVIVSGSFSGALQGAQRFDLVNAVQIPATVGIYLAALFGALLGLGLFGIVALIVVVRTLALVGFLVAYTQYLPGFQPFPASMFRVLFSFGGWVSVSNVVGPILVYADRVLLGSLVSAAAVGYYAAPYEVVTRALWVLPTAVSTALFPGFSAWTASGDRQALSRTFARAVKYLLLSEGVAAVALVIFADFVLRFWLGPEYAEHSTWAMRILSVGVLINSLVTVPYAALQGGGRPDLTGKFHLLELPVYVVTAWFLISLWGVTGAAAAWSARVALDGALLFWASRRILGVSRRSFQEAGIGKVAIGLFGFGLILAAVKACGMYVGPLLQWSILVLMGLSLLGVGWVVLLDDVDRRLILAWVRRR
jgi:O-antigen/teichoic acid export membrane protein